MKECTMTAKTVEEAIELACDRIGLPWEEVEIEIIDLPKKAFSASAPSLPRFVSTKNPATRRRSQLPISKTFSPRSALPHVEVTAKVEENNNAVITPSGEGLGVIITVAARLWMPSSI